MAFLNSIIADKRLRLRVYGWVVCLLCLSGSLPVAKDLHAAESGRPKRVLVLSTGSRFSPGFPIVEQNAIDELRKLHAGELEFYSEYLDIVRFPSKSFHGLFRDYLRNKYVDDVPDVIVLVFVGNLVIARQLLGAIFPGTPVVAAGLTEEELSRPKVSQDLTGIVQRSDPGGTIELILRLQPEIQRIVLIGGIAEVDRQVMARATLAARSFAGRVEFEVWDKRSMVEILQAVTALSPRTAILFTRMFRDGAGRAVNSSQAAQAVAKVSNVPVYLMSDPGLGTGAVGGSVANIPALGKRAGELAELILTGAEHKTLPLEVLTEGVPIFDWRALKRWGISESRLPQNSIVRFRAVPVWVQHPWYMAGALVIFLLQAALIAGLVVNRLNRRRAESELRENQELLEMATRAGGLGLWARDLRGDDVWVNSVLRAELGINPNEPVRAGDILARIHPDDRGRVVAEVERARDTNALFDGEFRMLSGDGRERWVLAKGGTVDLPESRGARRMGVLLDITERKRSEQAIRESEERFRTVANAAPVMIWMSGTDMLCTFFNKGWLDFTGRTPEQEIGNGWTEGMHRKDLDRCLAVYRDSFHARQEFSMEYRLRRYDGDYRWVMDHGVPRFEPDGTFLGYIGTATDITELKRGEEKFRLAVEASANASVMVNERGEIVLVNQQAEKLFGYSRDELIGQSVEILVPERFRVKHPEWRGQFFAAPESRKLGAGRDLYARRKDGSEVLVEIVLNPIRAQEGWLVLAAIVDISARRQAEEALEKERAFLRQVIDIDPNFIFAKDRQGRFTLANRAVADAYGTTVEDLIGKTDAEFNTNRDEVDHFHRMDLEVIDTLQERFIPEETITDASGKVRWLQTVKRPIVGPDGSADQVLGASTDITARKLAEAELQRNRDELAHMTRVSTLGELVASLAHELNQPLGAILSNAEAAEMLLKAEPPALDEVGEILADIRSDDQRASEVIRGLRGLLRRQEMAREPLQVNDAIGEVLRLLSIDAVHRKVTLKFEPAEKLRLVQCDRVQLQQVILNLVLNAMEAMAGQTEVTRQVVVRSGPGDDGMIKISVSDSGPGIPSDKLPKLFEPFFTTKSEGMGMGLSIARTIVEAHHGRIWAENNCGGGATFYFTLPVATEA